MNILYSFSYAIKGIIHVIRTERNMKIHVIVSIFVLGLGVYFSLNQVEWIFILLAIGGVLSLEMMNTAVERAVDLVTEDHHPLAMHAKDAAAGAVFIYAVLSVLIGCIIFIPKINTFF